ncbi:MAG: hypothetical protein WDW36_001149 [Sanguina aurantia]
MCALSQDEDATDSLDPYGSVDSDLAPPSSHGEPRSRRPGQLGLVGDSASGAGADAGSGRISLRAVRRALHAAQGRAAKLAHFEGLHSEGAMRTQQLQVEVSALQRAAHASSPRGTPTNHSTVRLTPHLLRAIVTNLEHHPQWMGSRNLTRDPQVLLADKDTELAHAYRRAEGAALERGALRRQASSAAAEAQALRYELQSARQAIQDLRASPPSFAPTAAASLLPLPSESPPPRGESPPVSQSESPPLSQSESPPSQEEAGATLAPALRTSDPTQPSVSAAAAPAPAPDLLSSTPQEETPLLVDMETVSLPDVAAASQPAVHSSSSSSTPEDRQHSMPSGAFEQPQACPPNSTHGSDTQHGISAANADGVSAAAAAEQGRFWQLLQDHTSEALPYHEATPDMQASPSAHTPTAPSPRSPALFQDSVSSLDGTGVTPPPQPPATSQGPTSDSYAEPHQAQATAVSESPEPVPGVSCQGAEQLLSSLEGLTRLDLGVVESLGAGRGAGGASGSRELLDELQGLARQIAADMERDGKRRGLFSVDGAAASAAGLDAGDVRVGKPLRRPLFDVAAATADAAGKQGVTTTTTTTTKPVPTVFPRQLTQ